MKYLIYGALIIIASILVIVGISFLRKAVSHQGHDSHTASELAKKQLYHCPMHPNYIADKPGKCPICGMDLVPIKETEDQSSNPIEGQAMVNITPQQEQLIGVKTGKVNKRELISLIRTSGRIAYDPDLYVAIAEYKNAVDSKNNSLIEAIALKLRQMGLSEEQIKELPTKTDDNVNLLLGGINGTVWVYAQIYEYEIGLVQSGQQVEVTSIAFLDKTFTGAIKAIDPILNKETRTMRVRAEVPNPEGLLKPEMYVDVKIHVNLGIKLAIPEEAILDSGVRQIVFVKIGEGKYEPREIKVGHLAENYYEVISGVSENEEVVTSANFFIDSESKLKSAISNMGSENKHGEEKK
ncbi:MAG: efflux RND transporter periplasmic adaptor subunit [Planctomycetota bacterium]